MAEDTTKTKEWKNDEVQVSVKTKEFCRVEMEVKASPSLVQKARKKAIKETAKGVSIPGFRKGRAPENLIVKNYPKAVEDRWQKALADQSFTQAQNLSKISILNNNSQVTFNVAEISVDSGATVSFVFETEPDVPEIDPKAFKLKKVERAPIGEKELEEGIRQMQLFYSQWIPITDRNVEEGDFVLLDLETLDTPPQKVFTDTRFEVKDKSMAKWMKKLILGHPTGAKLEGVSEPDDDEKKGLAAKKVLVTIKKIEKPEMPELNDDFARGIGSANMEEMRKNLEKMLNNRADEKVLKESKEQVNAFLIKNYLFDLPASLIETEKNHRKAQLFRDPKFKENWEKTKEEEQKKIEKDIAKQAEEAVRLFYLSRKIVQDAHLSVTYEEIQEEARHTLSSFGATNVDLNQIPREVYALSLSKVILAKAQKYILDQSNAEQKK